MAFQNQYINSSARAQGDAQDILGDLQGHFATIPHWEVEAVGRPGGFGVIARIRRTPRHSDGHVERLALKRALAGGHEEELALRNEIYWLKVRFQSLDSFETIIPIRLILLPLYTNQL